MRAITIALLGLVDTFRMYVRDLMTAHVVTVDPSESLARARQLLRQHRIHHLVVIEKDRVVGLVSYRDLIGKSDEQTAGEVMARDVVTVQPWDTVRNAASMMIGRSHGCLPVMNQGQVTGIITTSDLLRAVARPAANG